MKINEKRSAERIFIFQHYYWMRNVKLCNLSEMTRYIHWLEGEGNIINTKKYFSND